MPGKNQKSVTLNIKVYEKAKEKADGNVAQYVTKLIKEDCGEEA